MPRDVGVSGIRVETLADHQDGFAVPFGAGADERDVGCQGDITGDLLPNKLESVAANHIFSPLPATV